MNIALENPKLILLYLFYISFLKDDEKTLKKMMFFHINFKQFEKFLQLYHVFFLYGKDEKEILRVYIGRIRRIYNFCHFYNYHFYICD